VRNLKDWDTAQTPIGMGIFFQKVPVHIDRERKFKFSGSSSAVLSDAVQVVDGKRLLSRLRITLKAGEVRRPTALGLSV
jgi:hypothetical protein